MTQNYVRGNKPRFKSGRTYLAKQINKIGDNVNLYLVRQMTEILPWRQEYKPIFQNPFLERLLKIVVFIGFVAMAVYVLIAVTAQIQAAIDQCAQTGQQCVVWAAAVN